MSICIKCREIVGARTINFSRYEFLVEDSGSYFLVRELGVPSDDSGKLGKFIEWLSTFDDLANNHLSHRRKFALKSLDIMTVSNEANGVYAKSPLEYRLIADSWDKLISKFE